jgi:hypothetical protein
MKEWLVVDAQGHCDWLVLAPEAIAFATEAKRRAA